MPSLLALVDASPVLLLPSLLAARERSGDDRLHVALTGPPQFDASMQRLVKVLARHEITATVQERSDTLETTVGAWLATNGSGRPMLDVSSASGGTAARAVL